MKVSLIAAVADNGVIGRDGELPWRLPADLAHFKRTTMGHHLVVGRKPFESTGALPGRTTIVVSRRAGPLPEGVLRAGSPDEALALAASRGEDEAFVAGGEGVYRAALARADRLYLTRVHATVEGDAYFPDLALEEWRLVERRDHPADERHPYAMSFERYER